MNVIDSSTALTSRQRRDPPAPPPPTFPGQNRQRGIAIRRPSAVVRKADRKSSSAANVSRRRCAALEAWRCANGRPAAGQPPPLTNTQRPSRPAVSRCTPSVSNPPRVRWSGSPRPLSRAACTGPILRRLTGPQGPREVVARPSGPSLPALRRLRGATGST